MSDPIDIILGPDNLTIKVHFLNEDYVEKVYLMEQASYPDAWSKGLFYSEINSKNGKFFIFIANDNLIGYAGYWLANDEAHITKFTVAPEYRRKGLGKLFMNYIFKKAKQDKAKEIILEVRENNLPARLLYEKMGFETIGVRYRYYVRIQENAVVMKKILDDISIEE
ncbi:MAG: ribosomal protein S18-alanine N-acetyltransferase [Candidatus Hydrogenedentes bacterium]|nr:ribosomal protein S18-alanine N-acetyltransferase [Candidatus Hydrogenedentota bacterium]